MGCLLIVKYLSGFYNKLEHTDIESFKHKVFKGDTILNVTYNAHKDRVNRTISNRLCAFAMSSGDGHCSWSYFLNNFLPMETVNIPVDSLIREFIGSGCFNR